MDKKKLAIAGGIGLAIALLLNSGEANATDRTAGSETDADADSTATGKPSSTGSSGGTGATGFPIKRGSRGEKVRKLQQWLGVAPDGVFGPITETALKKRTGKTQIANQAAYDALFKAASVTNQTQPASSVESAAELAASLYTACYETRNVPILGPGNPPKQTGTRSVSSFRSSPDNTTIQRVLTARSDAELKSIGGVWMARYGTITSGGFGHTLDHWNSVALKMYGLWAIRVRLAKLGL